MFDLAIRKHMSEQYVEARGHLCVSFYCRKYYSAVTFARGRRIRTK
jgi:hypothetical protein